MASFKIMDEIQKESNENATRPLLQQKPESVQKNSNWKTQFSGTLKRLRNFANFCACRGLGDTNSVKFV